MRKEYRENSWLGQIRKMNRKFDSRVGKMPGLLYELKQKPPLTRSELVGIPIMGVYVFYKEENPIYVGRSNRLKERIQEHGRPSAGHNSAPFAFNVALEEIRRIRQIPKDLTRAELARKSYFKEPFKKAKARVANMRIRVIKIEDQVEQALFEIYASLALNTKYNDFGTH